jgi:hypothetical protein
MNQAILLSNAMNAPPDRIVYDRYIPKPADMMVKCRLLEHSDISGLIDDTWAKSRENGRIDGEC